MTPEQYGNDMSDNLEYIDAYFNGELEAGERQTFEARCSSDNGFAADVAFYIAARGTVREALLEQKQKEWQSDSAEVKETLVMKAAKKAPVLKWISYAAAACVLFIVAGYFLFYQDTPQKLAGAYLHKNDLYQTMDGGHDSIQMGISNYKSGNYKEAVILFDDVIKRDDTNSDAKEYAGQSYMQLKDYDHALERFRGLSAMKNLEVNSGDIWQATTLLLRNQGTDKEDAKRLLKKVVQEDEEGSKEAKEMLDAL